MQTISPALAAAYRAPLQFPARIVDVVPRGATIDTPALATLDVQGGTCDLDQSRPVRRNLSGLVVPVDSERSDLIPRKPGDLLHPVSGNEIRVRYGRGYKNANLLDERTGRFDDGLGNWRDWGPSVGNYWLGATSLWGSMPGKVSTHPLVVSATATGPSGAFVGGLWADPRGPGAGVAAVPTMGAAGIPYTLVGWAMPLTRSLVVHLAMASVGPGTSDDPGIYQELPQGIWSALAVTFMPRTTKGYSPFVEFGTDCGQVVPGDAVAFDGLGVFTGAGIDPEITAAADAEYNACGFYGLDKPVVEDAGDTLTVTLSGQDRAAQIQRTRWTKPFQIHGNTKIPEAIRQVLANRWPHKALPVQVDFSACEGHPIMDLTVPNAIFGSDHTAADPWADVTTMATTGGCEVYPDGFGRFVIVPYVQPDTVVASAWFTDGLNAGNMVDSEVDPLKALVKVSRALDLTKTYSGVVVTGGNSTDPTCRAEWWDTDPTSPTYVETFGEIPCFYDSPLIRNRTQARIVAQALGARFRMGAEVLTFDTIPNGSYEGSDGLGVSRPRAGVEGIYMLEHWQLDIADDPKPMGMTTRLTNQLEGVSVT